MSEDTKEQFRCTGCTFTANSFGALYAHVRSTKHGWVPTADEGAAIKALLRSDQR